MPNECNNRITITTKNHSDLEGIMNELPSQTVISQRGTCGVRLECTTAWKPDVTWLESVVQKWHGCWVKNKWISEDGRAGIWIGYGEKREVFEWNDLSLEDEFYAFQ
jgi:hypothetical protein